MLTTSTPIFIHSQFRSGSTYFFEVFRRSSTGYWCYQEPENEVLIRLADQGDNLFRDTQFFNDALRHPKLDKPYLAEFLPLRDKVSRLFRKSFAYDDFFLAEDAECQEFQCYLETLIQEAQGRPVLQFCRTTGRVRWLRKHLDAIHLFLWRNPWDQWWSYKVSPYFDMANLLILNAIPAPPVFHEVRRLIGFEEFHDKSIHEEAGHFGARGLDPTGSYILFYSLWLYSMHECLEVADLSLNVDRLSFSLSYRKHVLELLSGFGIDGLSFSDCKIHRSHFTAHDVGFFGSIERQVHELFARYGFSKEMSDHIAELRKLADSGPEGDDALEVLVEDVGRLRKLAAAFESERKELKETIVELRRETARLRIEEAKLQSIYRSPVWRMSAPMRKIYWKARAAYRVASRNKDKTSS